MPLHSGLSSPSVTGAQEPVAQLWHGAVQAPLQHVPSLQKPLAQSAGVMQPWPVFLRQTPMESQV